MLEIAGKGAGAMTPLQIGIMLHYYAMGDDYREADFSAPAVREAIDWLNDEQMIYRTRGGKPKCRITDKGRAYVDYLCAVPLPVVKYVSEHNSFGEEQAHR